MKFTGQNQPISLFLVIEYKKKWEQIEKCKWKHNFWVFQETTHINVCSSADLFLYKGVIEIDIPEYELNETKSWFH